MTSTTSEGGVWDQDQPPGNLSGRTESMVVKRTTRGSKQVDVAKKVVRDDWDDDDDDEVEEEVQGEVGLDYGQDMAARNDGVSPGPGPSFSGGGAKEAGRRQGEEEEDSSKIWEEANKNAPMPELIVAPASTSQSLPPPPPAAFQPTLRILKRPSPSSNNISGYHNAGISSASPATSGSGSGSGPGSGGTSPAPRGTLAEREAQYQEARSRIFGEKEKGASGGSIPSRTSSSSSGVVVIRDPLGPEPEAEPGTGGEEREKGYGSAQDRPPKGFGERRRGKR